MVIGTNLALVSLPARGDNVLRPTVSFFPVKVCV